MRAFYRSIHDNPEQIEPNSNIIIILNILIIRPFIIINFKTVSLIYRDQYLIHEWHAISWLFPFDAFYIELTEDEEEEELDPFFLQTQK